MSVDSPTELELKENQLTVAFGSQSVQAVWFRDSLYFVETNSDVDLYALEGGDVVLVSPAEVQITSGIPAVSSGEFLVITGGLVHKRLPDVFEGTGTDVLAYDASLRISHKSLDGVGSRNAWVSVDQHDHTIFVFWVGRSSVSYTTIDALTGQQASVKDISPTLGIDTVWVDQKTTLVESSSATMVVTSIMDDAYVVFLDMEHDTTWTKKIGSSVTRGQANATDIFSDGDNIVAVYQRENLSVAGDDSGTGIQAVVFDLLGNETARFLVNTQARLGNQNGPKVAITDDSNVLVAYFDEPAFNVNLELFSMDGTFLSSAVLKNGYTAPAHFDDGPDGKLLFSYGGTALGENFGGTGVLLLDDKDDKIDSEPLPGVLRDRITPRERKTGDDIEVVDDSKSDEQESLPDEQRLDTDNGEATNGDSSNETVVGSKETVLGGSEINSHVVLPFSSQEVQAVGLTEDGNSFVIKVNDVTKTLSADETLAFLDKSITAQQLSKTLDLTPVFKSVVGTKTEYVLPEKFTGPASLSLDYQLIDDTPNAVVTGSDKNDFIKVANANSDGKAVDAGAGDDVIDGGVGSAFVTGGAGSNTFFLDGRAEGVSWSTITDFKLGTDKATIWGWKEGVSRVQFIDEEGGAPGYQGVTLHFENLLPSDAAEGQTNGNLNSLTFSGKSLADFGAGSVEELNAQILAGTNSTFMTGVSEDQYGAHGYLYVS